MPRKEKPEGLENMGCPWNKSEDEQVLKEIKDGIDINSIAKAHKRTRGGITSRLRVIACEYYKNGTTINEIMALTGLSKGDIVDAISRRDYSDLKKEEKAANTKKTASIEVKNETEVLTKNLHPKNEVTELHEILKVLKALELRVTEYIKERSIFDE